jgi:hypothetical protein
MQVASMAFLHDWNICARRPNVELKERAEEQVTIPQDLVEFAEVVFKFKPAAYQLAMLREQSKRTVLL